MDISENKLIVEIEDLKISFIKTADKLVKDIQRQEKIMARSDKRQREEYDELQNRLVQVQKLQLEQKELMESFIKLIAGAIDAKSKYTGGHCNRVPELSMMLAKAASDCEDGIFKDFKLDSEDELRELDIASWLHDCGKVTTPEYVVDKATKLETIYNRIHEIRTRFEVIHRDLTIVALNKKLNGENYDDVDSWLLKEHQKLQDEFLFIANANVGAEFMSRDDKLKIEEIAKREWVRYFDDSVGISFEEKQRFQRDYEPAPAVEKLLCNKQRHIIQREYFDFKEYEKMGFKTAVPEHLYNLGEVYNICIERGTLTEEERFKINEHVMMTIKMLETLPFPANLKKVPMYAGTHHETLIGTGYPRQLTIDEMPIASRIMAIADVFEALTASDRPYKEPKKLSEAIKILSFMAKDKHIDADLFKLFLTSGIYKNYANDYLKPEQIDDTDITKYIG